MYVKIDPRIFDVFPDFRLALVAAYGIDSAKIDPTITQKLAQVQDRLKQALDRHALLNHPFIQAWHRAYQHMGLNPKEYSSSVENLAMRVIKGTGVRSINTLVDAYNTVSLTYLLPLGGQNLDAVQGDLVLTYATDQEQAVMLLGEKEAKKPVSGEILYKDDQGAVCRRWNWRESDRTKLTQQTTNALFELEALDPVLTPLLWDAMSELAATIQKSCGGTVSTIILDKKIQSVCVRADGKWLSLNGVGAHSGKQWPVYQWKKEAAQPEIAAESAVRIEKVERMRAQGIEPWPSAEEVPNNCKEILTEFGTPAQRASYTIAGRLTNIRVHGKTIFADVQDLTCAIQLYVRKDAIGDTSFNQFQEFVDIGDIVWVTGSAFRTKMGEITLELSAWRMLSKALHPMPEKFHGLTDVETRYRQRYLDLISNTESKKKFIARSRIIRSLRTFLDNHDFLEVETPMLHPIAGGAAARPFVTHHNALDSDFYLRIAPELYLKRLVVGGFDRVYEINRNFRNEGISTRHNPEFTMAEFYMAHHDYHFAMSFVEQLFRFVMQESCGTLQLPFGDHLIDVAQPFKRISIYNAVIEIGGVSAADLASERIDATIAKHQIKLANKLASVPQKIYALFEGLVESKLTQPTFVTEFPIEVSPLAKRDTHNPALTARFELFVGGMELSNGFNELNDPFDQAARFKQQLEAHRAGDEEAHQYDADYILALEYGLPPTVGVGIGIDRLVMVATNTTSIKDVILFPTLKKI